MNVSRMPNSLLAESSLYLRQHAYNPVDWHPWRNDVLQRAISENRLLIISIGYSACHWCHVMEREVFEKDEAAAIMNDHFICIKVDREERPDVDQVYMKALQLMNGQGGWPLNIFALPDGRPVYGGTYLPLERWLSVCESLIDLYRNQPEQLMDYASRLVKGIHDYRVLLTEAKPSDEAVSLDDMVGKWKVDFDTRCGGSNHVPKFPMPDNYLFLLRYGMHSKDNDVLHHVETTLHEMAKGGLRDWAGGGFSRYSVDAIWKVPHFEKMLYDNAQLLLLYAEAAAALKNDRFLEEAKAIVSCIMRDFHSPEGLFFSAIDADSEGIEGKFYCYTYDAFQTLCGSDFALWQAFFDLRKEGNWEHELNILHPVMSEPMICSMFSLSESEFKIKQSKLRQILLADRKKRIPPATDKKIITSWNALMISALVKASHFCDEPGWLYEAINAMQVLRDNAYSEGRLCHSVKNASEPVLAFLDDYATYIHACLDLFEATMQTEWYEEAVKLTDHILDEFDTGDLFFYFTGKKHEKLFAREMDTQDNVIPSSNAMVAALLLRLGVYEERTTLIERSRKMVNRMGEHWSHYPSAYSHWAGVYLRLEATGGWIVADAGFKTSCLKESLPYKPDHTILFKKNLEGLPSFLRSKHAGISLCGIHNCTIFSTTWEAFKNEYEGI